MANFKPSCYEVMQAQKAGEEAENTKIRDSIKYNELTYNVKGMLEVAADYYEMGHIIVDLTPYSYAVRRVFLEDITKAGYTTLPVGDGKDIIRMQWRNK